MFGYVKERVVATAVSAITEVLRRRGHTFSGSVTISSTSLLPLLEDLPDEARLNLERYIGDGLPVDFDVRLTAENEV